MPGGFTAEQKGGQSKIQRKPEHVRLTKARLRSRMWQSPPPDEALSVLHGTAEVENMAAPDPRLLLCLWD